MNSLCRDVARRAAKVKQDEVTRLEAKGIRASNQVLNRIQYLEEYASGKRTGSGRSSSKKREIAGRKRTAQSNRIKFKISLSHEMCYLPTNVIDMALPLAWNNQTENTNIKEIFLQRNPLSRAISIYYFWGELFKLKEREKEMEGKSMSKIDNSGRLGQPFGKSMEEPIERIFLYHGKEDTAPDETTATAFGTKLPYNYGMPGPSITWTAFAHSIDSAHERMRSKKMFTLVSERMEESLVVMRHFLGWNLADIVVTKPRKALSSHPKIKDWPQKSILELNKSLTEVGEWSTYALSHQLLDAEIGKLKLMGVDVQDEVAKLQTLQAQASSYCLQDDILKIYQAFISSKGWKKHRAGTSNHLRDTEDKYGIEGHAFSLNQEIMYTYDVCGNCEAHALLVSVEKGLANSLERGIFLKDLAKNIDLKNNINFQNCPSDIY